MRKTPELDYVGGKSLERVAEKSSQPEIEAVVTAIKNKTLEVMPPTEGQQRWLDFWTEVRMDLVAVMGAATLFERIEKLTAVEKKLASPQEGDFDERGEDFCRELQHWLQGSPKPSNEQIRLLLDEVFVPKMVLQDESNFQLLQTPLAPFREEPFRVTCWKN